MKTQTQHAALLLEAREANSRDFVLSEWRQLENRIGDRGLSCSADWTEVWLSVYGDLVPHRFLMAIDGQDGRLVGICLVTEGIEGWSVPWSADKPLVKKSQGKRNKK